MSARNKADLVVKKYLSKPAPRVYISAEPGSSNLCHGLMRIYMIFVCVRICFFPQIYENNEGVENQNESQNAKHCVHFSFPCISILKG